MKSIVLFVLIFFFPFSNYAQGPDFAWAKMAAGTGSETAIDMVTSQDGFIYSCGNFTSNPLQVDPLSLGNNGATDIFIIKYDTAGTVIWAKKYGSTADDYATAISTDSANNIYITGYAAGALNFGSISFGGGLFILKINSAGSELLVLQPASNVIINDIAADATGNMIICGQFDSPALIGTNSVTPDGSAMDGFVAKYNTAGIFSWAKIIHQNASELCKAVVVAPNGNIAVCGSYASSDYLFVSNTASTDTMHANWFAYPGYSGTTPTSFIISLNNNGDYLWGKDDMAGANSAHSFSQANSVAADDGSNFYVSFERDIRVGFERPIYGYTSKIKPNGELEWNVQHSYMYQPVILVLRPIVCVKNHLVYIFDLSSNISANFNVSQIVCYSDGGTYLWRSPMIENSGAIRSITANEKNAFVAGGGGYSSLGNLALPTSGTDDAFIAKLGEYIAVLPALSFNTLNRPDASLCPGGSYKMLDAVVVNGGMAPYSYSWSPALGLSDSSILSPIAAPATNTTYILTVKDARDSILRDTITVNRRSQLAKPTVSLTYGSPVTGMDTLVCNSSESNINYSWNWPGFNTSKVPVASNDFGGYIATITALPATSGCTASSDLFYYNIIKANADNDTIICSGQPVTLGGYPSYIGMAGAGGNVTYNWYSTVNGPISPSLSDPHITITPTVTSDYILYIQDGTPNPDLTDTVRIIVTTAGVTPTITANGPTTFCSGDSVILTSSPASTYLWSNGANTQSIVVTNSGNYHVSATNAGSCENTSADVTVTVNPAAETPTITAIGPTTFCAESNSMIMASPAEAYLWETGETTQALTVSTSGSYKVKIKNVYGCWSAFSVPMDITVLDLPAKPTITASGPTTFCQGDFITLTSSSGVSYLWSNFVTGSTTGAYFTDDYWVKVTDANGCTSHASDTLHTTVIPTPSTPQIISSGPTTFCDGGSVTLLSSIAGDTYLWNNTSSSQQSIIVTTTGTYSVKVIANGCESSLSQPVTVTVNPLPSTPVITANGAINFCEGNTVQLNSSTGHAYLWSNTETTASITTAISGSYTVQIIDTNNCQSASSEPVIVTVNPLPGIPVITQTGNTLHSSAVDGNQWYFNGSIIAGATEQDYTYSTGGDYSVTVTNTSGCSTSSSSITANRMQGQTLRNGDPFLYQVNANPVQANSVTKFTLRSAATVSIHITSITGKPVNTILSNKPLSAGTYIYPMGRALTDMPKGMYFIIYSIDGQRISQSIMVL